MRSFLLACLLLVGCGGVVRDEPLDDAAPSDGAPSDVAADTSPIGDDASPVVDSGFSAVVIEADGLAAYEGLTLVAVLQDRVEPGPIATRSAVIRDGRARLSFERGIPMHHFGVGVDLYVDRDGDGACTDGRDPAWFEIIGKSGETTTFAFRPTAEAERDCSEVGR